MNELAAELLDVGGGDDGLELADASGVVSSAKAPDRGGVGASAEGLADLGRKVIDKAAGMTAVSASMGGSTTGLVRRSRIFLWL